ncbi:MULTISPECIES: hypothetical protein [Deinococcus]|nr:MULTISPECIES: hypothetical protein [Deinococcus]
MRQRWSWKKEPAQIEERSVTVMAGVLLIALLGEVLRRLLLRQQVGGPP